MTGLVADAALVAQAALVLAVVETFRRRNVPAIVNGLLALGVALLPAAIRLGLGGAPGTDLTYDPALPLWLAVAGVIHTVGMLGLYDSVWWWDHLAHTVSAALVTALVYAAVLVPASAGVIGPLTPIATAGVTLILLLLFAVLWELVEELARHAAEEYDVGPILVVYGPYDAAFDLVFNVVGAGLVLMLDLRVFVPMFEPYPRTTAQLLLGASGITLVLVLVLGLFLTVVNDDWP